MSIEPKIERSSDVAVEEERATDRPRSTAEVARDLDRPKAREREDAETTTLFPENETTDFRTRWTEIQTGFVDEPRRAVEQADALVAEVIKRLADEHEFKIARVYRPTERSTLVERTYFALVTNDAGFLGPVMTGLLGATYLSVARCAR